MTYFIQTSLARTKVHIFPSILTYAKKANSSLILECPSVPASICQLCCGSSLFGAGVKGKSSWVAILWSVAQAIIILHAGTGWTRKCFRHGNREFITPYAHSMSLRVDLCARLNPASASHRLSHPKRRARNNEAHSWLNWINDTSLN